jgi:type I restriction enzyme M protein
MFGLPRRPPKIGYEISLSRYFYKAPPLRALEGIRTDIEALVWETEELLGRMGGGVERR